MGKATRWFRGLLGIKRSDPNPNPNPTSSPNPNPNPKKDKRRWSFVKSYREKSSSRTSANNDVTSTSRSRLHSYDSGGTAYVDADGGEDANKHAIAVAAATAAVAEAAVAAAQAAAAVVRMTSSGRCNASTAHVSGEQGRVMREVSAAVVIQSHFRSYLARRALRALKGLVKLQALVRGRIMRRKTAEAMRCMQAMLRAQARARSVRAYIPESPHSSTKSCPQLQHPGPPTPEKFEQVVCAKNAKQDHSPNIRKSRSKSASRSNTISQDRTNIGSSWSDPRMDEPMWDPRCTSSTTRTCITDEDRADRILEIDTGKPHNTLRRRNLFGSSHSGLLLSSDQLSHSYTTSKSSTAHHTNTIPSPSASCEVTQTLINPLNCSSKEVIDDGSYCTAENSPRFNSATSQGGSSRRGGSFTPTKSDGSRSFLSGYSDCPSYMAYTESSRAKVRSLSAPKQRPQYERVSSTKRYSVHAFGEHNPRLLHGQRVSAMQASFAGKAYPGSGRLDRLGMPVRDSTVVYYSGYLN